MKGARTRRRIAAGGRRSRSIGRATPSCASTYQLGFPSNPRPLRRRELPRVPRTLEKRLHEDLRRRPGENSRSNRGAHGARRRSGSSIICGSTMTRRPFKSGSRSRRIFPAHPSCPTPGAGTPRSPKRARSTRISVAIRRRRLALHRGGRARRGSGVRGVRVKQCDHERSRRRSVTAGLHLHARYSIVFGIGASAPGARRRPPWRPSLAPRSLGAPAPTIPAKGRPATHSVAIRPVRQFQRSALPVPLATPAPPLAADPFRRSLLRSRRLHPFMVG